RRFCTHTPWLWRPRASAVDGFSHGLTAARQGLSVIRGAAEDPFPPGAAEEPEGVCLGSGIGHPCGSLRRAGLRTCPETQVGCSWCDWLYLARRRVMMMVIAQ